MDNKITKKRINDHLEYDWYKYLIILVAGIVLFVFAFSQINATRDYEDVAFFVSCYESAEHKLEDRILTEMSSSYYSENHSGKYGDNVLREISFETPDPLNGDEYRTLYQTHGLISSDVLILGKSLVENSSGFLELTDELLNGYLLPENMTLDNEVNKGIDDFEYIEDSGGVRVGIKISGLGGTGGNGSTGAIFQMNWRNVDKYKNAYGENDENLPDDEFYLVINPKSVSIGKFGLGKSKPENAQALYAVNRFIEYLL